MQSVSAIHKACDLTPELRRAVEALLGRALQEDQNISVRAFKGTVLKEAPTGEARDEAFRRLLDRVDRTTRQAKGLSEAEIDAAIDEASDYVRRRRG